MGQLLILPTSTVEIGIGLDLTLMRLLLVSFLRRLKWLAIFFISPIKITLSLLSLILILELLLAMIS